MAAGKAVQRAADAAAWAKAETLYADRAVKIGDVAKLVGLAPIQLSNEAKRRGWPPRIAAHTLPKPKAQSGRGSEQKAGPAKTQRKRAPGTGQASKPVAHKPIVLVRRVYNTIDGELTKLERQTGASSQDRERASRALSQMVNSLEKAVEMQREIAKDTSKGSNARNKEALAHAEDLRRAIAERVERLNRKRAIGKRSGGAE